MKFLKWLKCLLSLGHDHIWYERGEACGWSCSKCGHTLWLTNPRKMENPW